MGAGCMNTEDIVKLFANANLGISAEEAVENLSQLKISDWFKDHFMKDGTLIVDAPPFEIWRNGKRYDASGIPIDTKKFI
jgi:hypothetical protein